MPYPTEMIQRTAALAAWAGLASLIYATLCPTGSRQHLPVPHADQFIGFAILGVAFAMAYPRRLHFVLLAVVGGALALELAQLLTPDRHARLMDAIIKAAGGVIGVGIIRTLYAATKRDVLRSPTAETERATPQRAEAHMRPE